LGIFRRKPTPSELYRAYCDGLPGAPADPAYREQLFASGCVVSANDAPIKDLHKSKPRVLLFQALRQLDSGALSSEPQTTGDCTSHGTRNAGDLTRAVEQIVLKEPQRFEARGATEHIYAGRGHAGAGMNAGRATRIYAEGQLLRRDYTKDGGPDLRKYNATIGERQGRSGIPDSWKRLAAVELRASKWVAPETLEDALDCMAAGFGGHAGSMFGSSRTVKADGLNRKTTGWSHDMAHAGYDLTRELWKTEVAFVPNSWGGWNEPNPVWVDNQDVLGPWIPGMLVVPLDELDRHIVKAREIYYLAHIEGEGIAALELPDYGGAEWSNLA
jgi:hypothetical protein